MQMLQLIYQIDVWEYHGATSPAPHMDTVIGWNWCVCVSVCVCVMANSFSKGDLHVIANM